MPDETFQHLGTTFQVTNTSPKPHEVLRGRWLRIEHEPNSSKSDVVGEVLSCRTVWPAFGREGHLPEVHEVKLALAGDPRHTYVFNIEDEYCELLEPKSPLPVVADEDDDQRQASRPRRDIVVCFDGTWNENERQNTNVHRLFELVDRRGSIANYYSGVGVGGRIIGNWLDGASGRGAFRTVRAAYTFVRGNYLDGDRIFIFGFSRGAFAARHLAGMFARVGIKQHAEVGYDEYRRMLAEGEGSTLAEQDVTFLGMFDCVPGNQVYTLGRTDNGVNDVLLEPGIRNVAHAVSRDERRWSFRPLIFESSTQRRFRQAWFPGYHSDVGGEGNEPLNDFALAWMLAEAFDSGMSLSSLPNLNFNPNARGHSSDWPQTKLGLVCDRSRLPEIARIESQPSDLHLRERIARMRSRLPKEVAAKATAMPERPSSAPPASP